MVVALHLPAFDVQAGSCEASAAPLTDLAFVELWGGFYEGGGARLLLVRVLSPREAGRWLELTLPEPRAPTWIWAVTLDHHGNASCASDSVLWVPPADVPPGPAPPSARDHVTVWDLAGRRVASGLGWQAKVPPGVYVERHGNVTRKVTVVR